MRAIVLMDLSNCPTPTFARWQFTSLMSATPLRAPKWLRWQSSARAPQMILILRDAMKGSGALYVRLRVLHYSAAPQPY